MSVDFLHCDCCGECRVDEFITSCGACGNNVCDRCELGNEHDDDGCLTEECCPICKKDKENEHKVKVGNVFRTVYFGKAVEVEIKNIIE